MCYELGIDADTIHIMGPYIVSMPKCIRPCATVPAAALRDCYISTHGHIVHCSVMHCQRMRVTRVHSVFMMRNKYLLSCDEAGEMQLQRGHFFKMCRFADVCAREVRVLTLYNYNFAGEVQTILCPDAQLIHDLCACCVHGLFDGAGWLVADARECSLSRFLRLLKALTD